MNKCDISDLLTERISHLEQAAAWGTDQDAHLMRIARDEIERLRAWHQNIVDAHTCASELYTSDPELAAGLSDRAQAALKGKPIHINAR